MKAVTGYRAAALGFAASLWAGAAAMVSPAFAQGGDLTIFTWSGYETPEFHEVYSDSHGGSPAFTFFGDEDEAFEKMRAGFRADLAHPCGQSVMKWREAGLLQPLDTSRIEAWDDILPGLLGMKDLVFTEDGAAWFMPWDWGTTAAIFNTDKVDEAEIESLHALADPKYQGRVSIGDNVDDAYALASLAIGLKDWTQMTDAQFEEASAFLREVHKNLRFYWTDTTQLVQAMSGGEVDIAWAWNSASTELAGQGLPVKLKRDTKEGSSTWVCGMVRLADAPGSEEDAYAYLNAVNDLGAARYLITDWGYGHATKAGLASVEEEVLAEKGYSDLDSFVDNTLFQSPLGPDLKLKMIAEFERIKAGY